ncbi:hypothetical protein MA16_Dca027896 [Dendrobium catenatum]|uniref:Uncharacterized protein n=1 Tax=Dendrobium catenatum TaxID=906689 RepID=A0A2I0VFA1_9ASPA|nr:hypothetical protein MA16_Dca027896 [Dendrobium catenatum]
MRRVLYSLGFTLVGSWSLLYYNSRGQKKFRIQVSRMKLQLTLSLSIRSLWRIIQKNIMWPRDVKLVKLQNRGGIV